MAQALPLTGYISAQSSSVTEYNILKISFGNGYEQRTVDGINSKEIKWSITYNNLSDSDRGTVWTFLDTVKAVDWFTWTPPGGTSTKFVVDGSVSEHAISGNLYSIGFNIRQVFDLT